MESVHDLVFFSPRRPRRCMIGVVLSFLQERLLPGRCNINGCPLNCVFTVCVFNAVCVHFGWIKCRALIPSMGHHTWPYVTSHHKKNSPSSSKNKLQHIQLSDTTGTSNGTGFYGQMKLKQLFFSSKHSR